MIWCLVSLLVCNSSVFNSKTRQDFGKKMMFLLALIFLIGVIFDDLFSLQFDLLYNAKKVEPPPVSRQCLLTTDSNI
jgi:preprotein translocase subunit SecG